MGQNTYYVGLIVTFIELYKASARDSLPSLYERNFEEISTIQHYTFKCDWWNFCDLYLVTSDANCLYGKQL